MFFYFVFEPVADCIHEYSLADINLLSFVLCDDKSSKFFMDGLVFFILVFDILIFDVLVVIFTYSPKTTVQSSNGSLFRNR